MRPARKLEPTTPTKVSKPPSPAGCQPDVHPQQTTYEFHDLTLDSCFDSGNMSLAEKASDTHYHIWIAPDCCGTPRENDYRTWFYFRAKGIKRLTTYTFTIKNMNFQGKLYSEGLVPVYKTNAEGSDWNRVDQRTVITTPYEKGIEVSFKHSFQSQDQEVYFAFTYPWSYAEDQAMIDAYEQEFKEDPDIYFHRELLVHSREQRRIDLLTITSHNKKLQKRENFLQGLFPNVSQNPRAFTFEKQYVLFSCRVHPGETPASFVFKGLMRFLLSKDDPRAQALRENFVIVLIPMLNPDGVYRGHYRTDTHGLNLNRYYINPSLIEHPSIYAAKQIMLDLNNNKKLFLYCDLHAHAGKKGCFVYGNSLEYRQHVDNLLFPKLLALNSEYFDFDCCDFSDKNVNIKDKGDGKDKEGAGRVALHKATNLVKCYTLECNYVSGKQKNILSSIPKRKESYKSHEETKLPQEVTEMEFLSNEKVVLEEPYVKENFEEVGEGIGPTLLDMINSNPQSRLQTSVYKCLRNVKLSIALKLMRDPPFRFDVNLRKINKNLNQNVGDLLKYIDDNVKNDKSETQKREARTPSKTRTLPPMLKRRTTKEEKEVNEGKDKVKEVKVVNIVVAMQVDENLGLLGKSSRPQAKVIIKKKPSVQLPKRFGSVVGKKPSTVM